MNLCELLIILQLKTEQIKYGPEITPYLGTFYAVNSADINLNLSSCALTYDSNALTKTTVNHF